jgi:adenosylcobinamide-GDP ribazoletransferase
VNQTTNPLNFLREQVRVFLTAVMFYTRIPCPTWVDHSPEYLNKATVYFPVIGMLMGLIAAGVYQASNLLWAAPVALLLSMVATIWLTGAFHEDGFADVCDGFGGGWSRAQILTIMKDSRLGTYGVVGLLFMLSAKFLILGTLPEGALYPAFILGHTASRAFAATFIWLLPYSREDEEGGKAKPVAQNVPISRLIAVWVFGLAPIVLLPNAYLALALLALFLPGFYLFRLYKKWLGGYSGDCLGAAQQLGELTLYFALAAMPWS